MRTARVIAIAIALIAVGGWLGFAVAAPGAAASPDQTKVLADLQAAYDGESNAHARYLAFAKKADEEGYGPVASLFRAAAAAEKIHADNHARVIRGLGGEPAAKVAEPIPASTRDNLLAAIKGESYERDSMYPGFIADAKKAGLRDALETFSFAKTAEAEHAKLYQGAVDRLAELKGKSTTYYVCSVCGYTRADLGFEKCISCFNTKDKYVAVS